MSVITKKLIRDILRTKAQIAAIVSIVSLGVACLVGMYQTFYNLDNSRITYYESCRMADFWVNIKKAPNSILKELKSLNGVAALTSRIVFPIIVDLENVDRPISGMLISLPEKKGNVINDIILKRGSYFTSSDKTNEVIISEDFSKARGINPGSFIDVIMNGLKKSLFVTGTAISSEYLFMTPPGGMAPDPKDFGVFWVTEKTAENVFNFHDSFNSLTGKLSLDSSYDLNITLDKIQEILNPYGVFSVTPLSQQFSNMTLTGELGGLKLMAYTMPAVFLFLAIMVMNIVMMRMAQQQRTIIGTLKALGYFNRDILIFNLKLGFLIGLTGGIAGVIFGYYFAGSMTQIYKSFFTFPNLQNHFYPKLYISAISISLIFAVLGAYKGAKSMVELSPAEAMRMAPPQKCSPVFLEKIDFIWSRLGFIWQYVIRSVFRNPVRSIVGFICSAVGTGIIVMSLGMQDALDYMMYFQYTLSNKADYIISFRNELPDSAVEEIKREPGIYEVIPEYIVSCTLKNGRFSKKCTIEGIIPGKSLISPYTIQGKAVSVPSEGILLCKRVADELHLKSGDLVEIIPVKGYQHPLKTEVAGIFETTFGIPVYADFNYLNRITFQEASVSSLQIKAQQTEAQKIHFMNKLKSYPSLQSLSVISEEKQDMKKNFIGQMQGMIYSLIVFAAVIFFASILNSALISISERTVEIATFRVLGYHNNEIGQIFFREILIVNIPGIFIGLPAGYLFLYSMCSSYKNDMYTIPSHIYNSTWVIAFVLSIIFVVTAYLIAKGVIYRLNWQDALKIKQ